METKLSVVICTFNRIELLSIVVNEVLKLIKGKPIELLIIDNNSTDNTAKDISDCSVLNKQLRYVKETKQGLSFARNSGIRMSNSPWVLFLDDDGFPNSDLFLNLDYYIDQQEQLIVGGHYSAWYYYGEKKWSKDSYYSNYPEIKNKTFLEGNQYLSGGLLLIHKSLFEQVGFFDTELGMVGNKIGYSEETEFQMRLKKIGIKMLYDPNLSMKHVVAKQKLNVDWFFKSKKALGFALYKTTYKEKKINILLLPFIFISFSIFLAIKNSLQLFRRKYYWENYIIDSFSKPYKWFCIWKSYFIL